MEQLTEYQRVAKIKRINTLIYACRLTANRPDILALWGAKTFDDMTDSDLAQCGSFMEFAYRCKTTEPSPSLRKGRSQVMTLLNRAGKHATPHDWTEVNRYLLQRKICGRLLYMLDSVELAALIRKLRAIVDKQDKAVGAAGKRVDSDEQAEAATVIIPGCMPGRMLLN